MGLGRIEIWVGMNDVTSGLGTQANDSTNDRPGLRALFLEVGHNPHYLVNDRGTFILFPSNSVIVLDNDDTDQTKLF